jgi:dTDP-4-dehydrorhamnose 3,5-epimerase-like enzyme
MDYKIDQCIKYTDVRGYLVEFLKNSELNSSVKTFGQIYFVTFEKPNQVRGNHFHTRLSEWFGVAQGTLQVILEDVKTKERKEFTLSSDDKTFTRLTIGPYIAHAFRNITPTAVLLDYSSHQYDPKNNDRNPYLLISPQK